MNRVSRETRPMRAFSACCAIMVALTGCSLAPGGGKIEAASNALIAAGVSDRRSFNDKEADVLLALPCDISLGAYYRLGNSVQQEALVMLCSGRKPSEPEVSLTSVLKAP